MLTCTLFVYMSNSPFYVEFQKYNNFFKIFKFSG